MITARAIGRTYRFRPSDRVVAMLRYCLVVALAGLNIDVHEFCWMSNHWHIVLTDHAANLPVFLNKVHSLISRNLNAMRGIKGKNFEDDYTLQVETDPEAIARACAYTLANPVRANLVAGMRHWKGLHSGGLKYGQEIVVRKPNYGIWKANPPPSQRKRKRRVNRKRAAFHGYSSLPDTVTFKLVRPPIMLGTHTDAEVRESLLERVRVIEAQVDARRLRTGSRPLGMKAVRSVEYWEIPTSRDELFATKPKSAASTTRARQRYQRWYSCFVAAYRAALSAWCGGERDVEFPYGTYMMRERFSVQCAGPP